MRNDLEAYSDTTGKTYPNWDALVAAETNGYVVVGLVDRPNTHPVVVGPYATEAEAKLAQSRLRRRWKREEWNRHGTNVKVTVYIRHLWKEKP